MDSSNMDWEHDNPSPSRVHGARPESAGGRTGRALLPVFKPSACVVHGSVVPGSDDSIIVPSSDDPSPSQARVARPESAGSRTGRTLLPAFTPSTFAAHGSIVHGSDNPSPSQDQMARPESATGHTGRTLLPAFTPSAFIITGSVVPRTDDTLPDAMDSDDGFVVHRTVVPSSDDTLSDIMDSDDEPSPSSTINTEEKSTICSRKKVMSKDLQPVTPPHMRRRTRMLEEYRIEQETAVFSNQVIRAALARRANEPPRPFVADGTIQLLPEWCGINLAAATPDGQMPEIEPFELPRPEFVQIPRPTKLVGKVKASFDAATYRETHPFVSPAQFVAHEGGWQLPGRQMPGPEAASVPKIVVDPPTPTAGREVYMRPQLDPPYFDLITKEGEDELPVSTSDAELNENADTEVKRLELLAGMLMVWEWELVAGCTTFNVQAMNWRKARCEWELETVREVFFSGNLAMLPADFGVHSLIQARLWMEERNDLELEGEIEMFEHICEPQVCEDYLDFHRRVKKAMCEVQAELDLVHPGAGRGAE